MISCRNVDHAELVELKDWKHLRCLHFEGFKLIGNFLLKIINK